MLSEKWRISQGGLRCATNALRHACWAAQFEAMASGDFLSLIHDWASRNPQVDALMLIGSRAQSGAQVDERSDWDFHLVVKRPNFFLSPDWLRDIAPVWNSYLDHTERGVKKLSVIFVGGVEADFVILPAWQLKLAYWAMCYPRAVACYPAALHRGIANLRLIAKPGCRVVVGGRAWEHRITALEKPWPDPAMSEAEFQHLCSGFWRHLVWAAKKTARGEFLAAQRWHFHHARENLWKILEEDARTAGRISRPEARQAEGWLGPSVRDRFSGPIAAARGDLAKWLEADCALFSETADRVARTRGFSFSTQSEMSGWLGEMLKHSKG